MAGNWYRHRPYEKALKTLCENGDVITDCKASDIFKEYNHFWAPVKLDNFRKHFKRVVTD